MKCMMFRSSLLLNLGDARSSLADNRSYLDVTVKVMLLLRWWCYCYGGDVTVTVVSLLFRHDDRYCLSDDRYYLGDDRYCLGDDRYCLGDDRAVTV